MLVSPKRMQYVCTSVLRNWWDLQIEEEFCAQWEHWDIISREPRISGFCNLWCSVKTPLCPLSKNAISFFVRDITVESHLGSQEDGLPLLKVKAHEVQAVATLAFKQSLCVRLSNRLIGSVARSSPTIIYVMSRQFRGLKYAGSILRVWHGTREWGVGVILLFSSLSLSLV